MQTNAHNTCILHIGMPKTGTSAIQAYLYHALEDASFRYVSFGRADGSGVVGLATLFSDEPANWYFHKKAGFSEEYVTQLRESYLKILEHEMIEAKLNKQVLLLSAESCWNMNASEFSRIRTYLQANGFSVRIIAYIRPWKAWMESAFQQNVKSGDQKRFLGGSADNPLQKYQMRLAYQEKFQLLEQIFGKAHVHFYLYDTKVFPGACVVQDFCRHIGMSCTISKIRRANESLNLPAIQLLYAAIKYRPGFEQNTPGVQIS